jgi:hypothetical protein
LSFFFPEKNELFFLFGAKIKKRVKEKKNLVPSGQSINLNASTTNRVTGF